MDAIKLLTEDHQKVRKLLKDLCDTTARAGKTRTELLSKIALELKVHSKVEEDIFYPAFKQAGDGSNDQLYFESLEEHRAVEELVLPDLQNTEVGSEKFAGRAKVLKDLIEHHADEEEHETFKRARKQCSEDELKDLGQQLAARKKDLLREMGGK